MVRLGTVTPKIWEDLEQQGVTQDSIEEAAAAAEAAKERAAQLAKEALSEAANIDWKKTADAAKEAREIDEKYGIFKDIILSPWFNKLLRIWDKIKAIQILGEPRMSPAAIIILLFMLLRAKQPFHVLLLVAAFFYNIHPVAIVGVTGAVWLWGKVRRPRMFKAAPRVPPGGIDESLCKAEDFTQVQQQLPDLVDHIIIGSDLGALYCGALLSRLGHKVLVVEGGKSLGNCMMTHKDLPFDWGSHALGHMEIFEDMLRGPLIKGASPDIHWVKIGTEADGFSFDIATVGNLGEVIYRAGARNLIDDQVTTAPDHRDKVGPFVGKVDAAAREHHGFFVGKLFNPSTTRWLQSMLGATYAAAAGHTAAHIFNSNLPEIEKLDVLRGIFRDENLRPSDLSFAAYATSLHHGLNGVHYPLGGYQSVAQAFTSTIRVAGGKVLINAPVKSILLDDGNKVATGVKMEGGGGSVIKCRISVISSAGIVPTYTTLLPNKVPLPLGVGAGVKEARPRLYTLLVLKGSVEELDLPASDYYHVVTDDATQQEWLHVSFPCAKDPRWSETFPDRCTCIMETEADDDLLDLVCRKDVATTTTTTGNGTNGGSVPPSPQKTPSSGGAEKGGAVGGLYYYKYKSPSEAKLKRMHHSLLRRLVDLYPQLEGRIEDYGTVGPFRAGLSHTVPRFQATGLRPCTSIQGLYLCGKDLTIGTFAGGLYSGWLAAHAVTGYTALDLMLFQRNLIRDLTNTSSR